MTEPRTQPGATPTEPQTDAGKSLLRQWIGHPNETEVRIVVTAIERQERHRTVERIIEVAAKDRCSPPCLSFVNGEVGLRTILDESKHPR